MSFSTTTNKKFFNGDTVITAFPVTEYVVYKDTHVEVTVDSVVQTLVTDYTVAINTPLPGQFTVNFEAGSVPPVGTSNVLVKRVVPLTQEIVYQPRSKFPAKTHEKAIDLSIMAEIQLKEEIDRAMVRPTTTLISGVVFPDPVAGLELVRWNAAKTDLELINVTTLGAYVDPITTRGDLLRGSSTGAGERLALGAAGLGPVSDGTDLVNSGARSVRETGGPAELAVGAIVDGDPLVREGAAVVGGGVRKIRETGGPTVLTLGAIADGQTIRRSGTTLVGAGGVVQSVIATSSAVGTGATIMPQDDTIPQKTEGDEFLSLAITPKKTTNRLVIEAMIAGAHTASVIHTIALFQDATADALAAMPGRVDTVDKMFQMGLIHEMQAGTISATTFKIRVGGSLAGTFTRNGISGGRQYGGVASSFLRITEFAA